MKETLNSRKYALTILGCGSSAGVPSIEMGWGLCDKNNPKNYRTRTSAYLEITDESSNFSHNILFDVSLDFRKQALDNKIKNIETVMFTHHHSDHIYGIDDLRGINRLTRKPISCYADPYTKEVIENSFSYIFNNQDDRDLSEEKEISKPCLSISKINYHRSYVIKNTFFQTTMQRHGKCNTVGYVIDNKIAYATDFSYLSEEALNTYKNLDLIVMSATVLQEHPSHYSFDKVLDILKYLNPKRALITHMSGQIDYEAQSKDLPSFISLCYDGLKIQL